MKALSLLAFGFLLHWSFTSEVARGWVLLLGIGLAAYYLCSIGVADALMKSKYFKEG